MNEFDQRIREHQMWTEMRKLGPAIDGAAAVPDLTPQAVLGLERLRAILAYIGKRIAAADPLVTPPGPLDAIVPVLAAAQNELTAFISDKDPAHIVTANVTADGALMAIAQVPGAYSPEELGVLVSKTTGYRKVVSDALTDAQQRLRGFKDESDKMLAALGAKSEADLNLLSARAEALQGSLNAISSSVDAERQRLANIASEQQGQFSASQEARSTQFNENFRVSTERFTQLVADYQKQFSDAQDARGKENTAAELVRQTKYNETVAGDCCVNVPSAPSQRAVTAARLRLPRITRINGTALAPASLDLSRRNGISRTSVQNLKRSLRRPLSDGILILRI